jgi:hypothetical protein
MAGGGGRWRGWWYGQGLGVGGWDGGRGGVGWGGEAGTNGSTTHHGTCITTRCLSGTRTEEHAPHNTVTHPSPTTTTHTPHTPTTHIDTTHMPSPPGVWVTGRPCIAPALATSSSSTGSSPRRMADSMESTPTAGTPAPRSREGAQAQGACGTCVGPPHCAGARQHTDTHIQGTRTRRPARYEPLPALLPPPPPPPPPLPLPLLLLSLPLSESPAAAAAMALALDDAPAPRSNGFRDTRLKGLVEYDAPVSAVVPEGARRMLPSGTPSPICTGRIARGGGRQGKRGARVHVVQDATMRCAPYGEWICLSMQVPPPADIMCQASG